MAANLILSPVLGGIGSPTAAVISPETNRPLSSVVASNKKADHATKAKKIDAYFAKYDLPLSGYGEELVSVAEKYDLPWPLIAAVAMQESTGGKFACRADRENMWGYGSCKSVNFESVEQGIELVAKTIAAQSPGTKRFYENKSLEERLRVYNGRAVANYAESVHWIMEQIEETPASPMLAEA